MGERKSMRIQGGVAALGLVGEVAFVPEGALVVEECGALGVPVAGDFEGGGLGEVVFEARAGGGGVVFGVVGGAVEVGGEDEVPVAVEGEGGSAVEGDEEGGGWRRRCGGSLGQEGCGERRGECGGDGESDDAMAHGAGPRGADAIGCDWWCAAARMTILMHCQAG